MVVFVSQVVNDVTDFYKETYDNYKKTKQEALKETLRLIHFGVRHKYQCLFATTLQNLAVLKRLLTVSQTWGVGD